MYLWQSHYLVWLQFLDPYAAFQMGSRDAAACCDSCSDSICSPLGANSLFCNWQSPQHHSRTLNMFYGRFETGGCSSFNNSSLHTDPPIWPKYFELWFTSPKDFIPLLNCPVFVCLGPLEHFDIILIPRQNFLDWNSAI